MNKKSTLRSVANDYLTHPRKNKGITLIALVVTIIILLILSGISIASITSDNGILTNTKKAKFMTEVRNIDDQIQLNEWDKEHSSSGEIKNILKIDNEYNDILYVQER